MYLLIYPPAGKQKIGNVEATDHITYETLSQVTNGSVRVVDVNLLGVLELIVEKDYIHWVEVKTLRKSDME